MEVRVVGTIFNIYRGPVGVTLAVAEGKVEVRDQSIAMIDSAATPKIAQRQISVGQQIVVAASDEGLTAIVDAEPIRVGAWRTGFLHYNDATLGEVVADINRYSQTPKTLADERFSDLLVDTASRTSQSEIDSMVDNLPEIVPVIVDRSRPDRIVLRSVTDNTTDQL